MCSSDLIALFFGLSVISLGRKNLKSADHLPTDEEDVAAMEDNADKTK